MIDFIGAGCGIVKAWGREQSEKKKIEAQSRRSAVSLEDSKSKDAIDFIRIWFEEEGDWKKRPLVPIY